MESAMLAEHDHDPTADGLGVPPFGGTRVARTESLAEKVRRREQQLARNQPIDLEVPGYPMLVARYHALGVRERTEIAKKHQRRPDEQLNLYAACDYLINACDDILERKEDGSLESLGHRWGPEVASELWGRNGIGSARQALLAIFPHPRDTELIDHANELLEASKAANVQIDEELVGEYAAS